MKHELKPGMKVKFKGPITNGDTYYYNPTLAKIIEATNDLVKISIIEFVTEVKAYIYRRQVTHVIVKKKKERKYPREVWVNIYSDKDMQAHINKEIADALCSATRLHGKAIRYVLAKGQ